MRSQPEERRCSVVWLYGKQVQSASRRSRITAAVEALNNRESIKVRAVNIIDSFLPAVRRWAPSAVWIGGEAPPQQELLILVQKGRVIQDVCHLLRGQSLGTLGAAQLDSTLCDLDAEVLPQAAEAGAVAAPQQLRELLRGLAHQAQGALQEVALPGGGGSTQGRLAGGQWL